MSSAAGTPLPPSYRWALIAAVVLGFQVSLAAAFDVHAALNHDEPLPLGAAEAAFPGIGLTPLAQRQMVLAANSGQQSALVSMLPWRTGTSVLLTLAAGLVFIFGMRLRVSGENRVGTAQQLGVAALASAALRSLDGAQNLVIMRTMVAEMGKVILQERPPEAEALASVISFSGSVASVGWTVVMVASFVTLGNYFRSADLRVALARAEP